MLVWFPNSSATCIIENQLILHSSTGGFEMRWQLEYFVEIGAFIKSIYADQSVGK